MISRILALCILSLVLTGCMAKAPMLSGPVVGVEALPETGLRIGFVADSQLQTRSNYNRIFGYRDNLADFFFKTAIRPPALDWAARAMLRENLEQLRAQKAQAIFYLGDGANNGCYDEFALGFRDGATPKPNSVGVLALLDEFRKRTGIPIFFTLGNHDMLFAGSTASILRAAKLCDPIASPNRKITKLEAMKLVDDFNKGNAALAGAWRYRSNWNETAIGRACAGSPEGEHRRAGCYLAATVDYLSKDGAAQFLLLDTNDWVDVTPSVYAGLEQEGIRGAMSFRDDESTGLLSQTGWFDRNASEQASLRIALSHYDVAGLTKRVPLVGKASSKSQMYMNLFTDDNVEVRKPIQDSAYVVTGHTHVRKIKGNQFQFKMDCGPIRCAPTNRFRIRELNVGSTTDYSNYATIAQFQFANAAEPSLGYRRVQIEPTECAAVWNEVATHQFPNALSGHGNVGWLAIGVNKRKPTNYHSFRLDDVQKLWENLDEFVGTDQRKAACIGLYAAAVEVKIDPTKPRPARH